MKSKTIIGFLSYLLVLFCLTPSFSAPVPDTGQTQCYDDGYNVITCPTEKDQDFYGQDANYSRGRSYTKLDSTGKALADSAALWAMVRDNISGLIWETKTNKDGTKNYNDPHDADNIYTWYDPTAIDPGREGDGKNTNKFLDALNTARFGGYSDWRLPTIKELGYIVDRSVPSPGPTSDKTFFPDTITSHYWSSTTNAGYTNAAWLVFFLNGIDDYYDKSSIFSVRAVRGGQ